MIQAKPDAKSKQQPNFLFLVTDQHRADWLGCYGHPVVKTPNLDAIAARGMRFDNFHVAAPVCMPNRASLMTGRYPTVHGLRYNGCTLPVSANTFVDVLATAGYQTAAIGKSHLQPFTGNQPMHKRQQAGRLIEEAWQRAPGDYQQEEGERYGGDNRYPFETPYYGFNHVDMVTSHGDRCGGHYGQWFRKNVSNWRELHDPANELPHTYTCPQAYRTPVPEELYSTAYIADRAIDYIGQAKDSEAPFFAFVSFPDPHHPFNPPGKYWDMYKPEQFDIKLPFSAHQNPTPPMLWMREQWQSNGDYLTPQTGRMVDDQALREAMALTAGMITCVDDAIGRIINALEQHGLDDNTIICFTADHGDYMGDFNMLLKGAVPLQSINRVPFLWADPRRSSIGSTPTLASTVDIAATVLDRAQLVPYNGMQGRSLGNTLATGAPHRDELLVEFNDVTARLGFEEPARVRSLINERWRYTIYGGLSWGELYDRQNDPDETHNLWDDPQYRTIRGELAERLAYQLTNLMDESPLSERAA
ncbi:MAG: sulfatase-like hydrolase/transferase [Burkholderiaceae bacterium]